MTQRARYRYWAVRCYREVGHGVYYVKPFHQYWIVCYRTRTRYMGFVSVPYTSRGDAWTEAIRLNVHALRYCGCL